MNSNGDSSRRWVPSFVFNLEQILKHRERILSRGVAMVTESFNKQPSKMDGTERKRRFKISNVNRDYFGDV